MSIHRTKKQTNQRNSIPLEEHKKQANSQINQSLPSFTRSLPPEIQENKNFFAELKAFDQGTLTANEFFMKNLLVFKKVYEFTSSNSINIEQLKNAEIAAIIICLFKIGKSD